MIGLMSMNPENNAPRKPTIQGWNSVAFSDILHHCLNIGLHLMVENASAIPPYTVLHQTASNNESFFSLPNSGLGIHKAALTIPVRNDQYR